MVDSVLAYFLGEYKAAGEKAEKYNRESIRLYNDGYEHFSDRLTKFRDVQRVRQTSFYDAIRGYIILNSGLDPDDVAAAEKALEI